MTLSEQTLSKLMEIINEKSHYRDPFLATAMMNLNLVETAGGGIRKLFEIQKKKFFPLPEYELSADKVKVTFTGKIINMD